MQQRSALLPSRHLGLLGQMAFVGLAVVSLLLAACGGSSATTSSKGPVDLTFWTWVPNMAPTVNLFNQTHPNIHIKLVEVPTGKGGGTYAKMLTAIKAGNPPDLGQVEFDSLPVFETTGGLLDLSAYGANSVKNQFIPWTWNQVTQGSAVYAIPQATGSMGMFYRKDIFQRYNLPVPTTWAQYADDAAKLHQADPSEYITDFAPKDPSWFISLTWQNGGQWFGANGQNWRVTINESQNKQVADYWQNLLSRGLVKTEPDFASGWYNDFQTGKLATWLGAQWSIDILESEAPKASGDWAVAPMPQWQAGQQVDSNWGGSTTAVFKATKHPKEATEFAIWLNTNLDSWKSGLYKGGGLPCTQAALAIPQFHQADPYFSNQDPNTVFIQGNSQVNPNFVWGPTMQQVVTDGGDDFANVVAGQGTLSSALDQLQTQTVAAMKQQGFSVSP